MAAQVLQYCLWIFVVCCGLLGLLACLVPDWKRGLIRVFLTSGPVRVLGVAFLVAGALLFAFGGASPLHLLVRAVATVLFVLGGVQLVIPTVAVVVTEWWLHRGSWWVRLSGLLYLLLAYLFYLAAVSATALATEVQKAG